MNNTRPWLAAVAFALPCILPNAALAVEEETHIIRAVNAVGATADQKDWPACRSLFEDMVYVDYSELTGEPPRMMPADELIASWAKALGPVQMTQHNIMNHAVSFHADLALVRSDFTAMHRHPVAEGQDFWFLVGSYRHVLRRSDGGPWKVVSIVLIPRHQEGNPRLIELAAPQPQ